MHTLIHPLHPLARQLRWIVPMSVLALFAMPAHAAMLETPSVKDGLSLGIYGSINPNFSTESNKFNYTYGDPRIFGTNGSVADVLANQDRKDSDEQLRLNGLNWGSVEFYASQRLTPKITANSSILIEASESDSRNQGAYWGAWFDFGTYGEQGRLSVGSRFNRLGVSQTGLGMLNTMNDTGTNINARYTGVPNLTLSAYHMLTQSADVNNRRALGWHHSDGVSAKYDFDFAPRKTLTLAGGYSRSKGHDDMAYYDVAEKADAYLLGVGFRHNDWMVGLDYGEREESYNGYVTSGVDKKVYGAKVDYEFTPRLKGTLSYGHSHSKNNSPAPFERMVDFGRLEPYSGTEALFFDKVEQDRYSVGLQYELYKGITLNGSVTNLKTTNYVTEGEFSNREQLTANIGASFSF
ncbi:porin [Moraxella bovis]|uniref:Porin n=1 Tax=Moraxella bovis TaxID=476 RepID=A0AAQ2Q370_MORBO|nr:porin [Moraxella bovis]UYZ70839.1 porin [Moraxella bovis]UYZ73234.1 porin [Moraxella bovis]UYZ75691.1 porin [Moraxella bovis]UYZ78368.1 porin [Moraxella bovis]UYZ86851.1 porin [Moraxella bovis]